MTPYLDASVLVSLIIDDAHTERAHRLVSSGDRFLVSDLAAAEFTSAIAIRWRSKTLSEAEARGAFLLFDAWRGRSAEGVDVLSADIRAADQVIRTLSYSLRTPDAIHLVVARRLDATLATFDEALALAAERCGLRVVTS